MKALVLRLDAPLLSFGAPIVDQHGFTDRFPGTAMLTGLLGNALGWRHGDADRLESLQARLRFAARWDVPPLPLVDYQTVDLGQPKMREPGWTTRGEPEHRAGGEAARFGTHQRWRHHWMDGLMTVVISLDGDGEPGLGGLEAALRRPARPLFLGRKACLPARPLLDPATPVREGPGLHAILESVPRWDRHGRAAASGEPMEACWPADGAEPPGARTVPVHDLREWATQLPAGSRERHEGLVGGSPR